MDSSTTRTYGGTGLGLAISKQASGERGGEETGGGKTETEARRDEERERERERKDGKESGPPLRVRKGSRRTLEKAGRKEIDLEQKRLRRGALPG